MTMKHRSHPSMEKLRASIKERHMSDTDTQMLAQGQKYKVILPEIGTEPLYTNGFDTAVGMAKEYGDGAEVVDLELLAGDPGAPAPLPGGEPPVDPSVVGGSGSGKPVDGESMAEADELKPYKPFTPELMKVGVKVGTPEAYMELTPEGYVLTKGGERFKVAKGDEWMVAQIELGGETPLDGGYHKSVLTPIGEGGFDGGMEPDWKALAKAFGTSTGAVRDFFLGGSLDPEGMKVVQAKINELEPGFEEYDGGEYVRRLSSALSKMGLPQQDINAALAPVEEAMKAKNSKPAVTEAAIDDLKAMVGDTYQNQFGSTETSMEEDFAEYGVDANDVLSAVAQVQSGAKVIQGGSPEVLVASKNGQNLISVDGEVTQPATDEELASMICAFSLENHPVTQYLKDPSAVDTSDQLYASAYAALKGLVGEAAPKTEADGDAETRLRDMLAGDDNLYDAAISSGGSPEDILATYDGIQSGQIFRCPSPVELLIAAKDGQFFVSVDGERLDEENDMMVAWSLATCASENGLIAQYLVPADQPFDREDGEPWTSNYAELDTFVGSQTEAKKVPPAFLKNIKKKGKKAAASKTEADGEGYPVWADLEAGRKVVHSGDGATYWLKDGQAFVKGGDVGRLKKFSAAKFKAMIEDPDDPLGFIFTDEGSKTEADGDGWELLDPWMGTGDDNELYAYYGNATVNQRPNGQDGLEIHLSNDDENGKTAPFEADDVESFNAAAASLGLPSMDPDTFDQMWATYEDFALGESKGKGGVKESVAKAFAGKIFEGKRIRIAEEDELGGDPDEFFVAVQGDGDPEVKFNGTSTFVGPFTSPEAARSAVGSDDVEVVDGEGVPAGEGGSDVPMATTGQEDEEIQMDSKKPSAKRLREAVLADIRKESGDESLNVNTSAGKKPGVDDSGSGNLDRKGVDDGTTNQAPADAGSSNKLPVGADRNPGDIPDGVSTLSNPMSGGMSSNGPDLSGAGKGKGSVSEGAKAPCKVGNLVKVFRSGGGKVDSGNVMEATADKVMLEGGVEYDLKGHYIQVVA
jgi:hypothetical protein